MNKILFFIAWLGILSLSLAGITFVVYPVAFNNIAISDFVMKMLILNVSILYLFFTVAKIKSKFPKKVDYILSTDQGKVVVSANSIKSMIKEIISLDEELTIGKVDTRMKGSSLNVYLEVETYLDEKFPSKSLVIQESIKRVLKQNMGVEVSNVDIKLIKLRKK